MTTLARSTIGFSGADLQALVNQAAVKASADGAPLVSTSHFDWARERVRVALFVRVLQQANLLARIQILMGSARKSAFISDQGKLKTAYHEGGHAVRYYLARALSSLAHAVVHHSLLRCTALALTHCSQSRSCRVAWH